MKDNQIIYKTVKAICYPFFMLLYHPTIINKKNLPKKEGFILAGNHKKNWDVFVLIVANKRKVHFFILKYFFIFFSLLRKKKRKRSKRKEITHCFLQPYGCCLNCSCRQSLHFHTR